MTAPGAERKLIFDIECFRLCPPEAVGKLRRSIYAQKILLDFVNLKINNARQRYREEAIEKTILRILASCVFSHSLAP